MFTVLIILACLALVCVVLAAFTPPKCPLWLAVLFLAIYALVQQLPVGHTGH